MKKLLTILVSAVLGGLLLMQGFAQQGGVPIYQYGTKLIVQPALITDICQSDQTTCTEIGGTTVIGVDEVKDTMIDWGTGANQVSSADMPDHDGHSVRDTFVHTINRGKSEAITVSLTGGLGASWTVGEIYDITTHSFISTIAGSGTLTNTAVNYLKWVSGTGLTLGTADVTGNEILVATFSVYDGIISGHRESSLTDESVSNVRRGLRALFPNRIESGMSVSEDTDATNPLDVTMDAGVMWKEMAEIKTPIEIKTRTTAMVRHFHTAGVWDSDTNAQIETTNYDNGTTLTAIPANKYVKGLFIFMNGKIGFIYPTEYFTNIAQAQEAALPAMPTGLEQVPKLTAVIYQQGAADFTNAIWQDIRSGISEQSFSGVTDHGALAGLADDDHTQYLLANGTRGLSANWDAGAHNITATAFIGALTGNADTVSTITGLAPDTATTQTAQPNIISLGTITALVATDATVTNTITGSITGQSGTVVTIAGLAPNTATTQAAQPNITSLGTITALVSTDATINESIGFDAINTVTYNATTTTADWSIGNVATMTFGAGNVATFAFTDPPTVGQTVKLKLIQDATGSRTITAWDASVQWSGGGDAPTLSTGANAEDWVVCIYTSSTTCDCSASLDFQ